MSTPDPTAATNDNGQQPAPTWAQIEALITPPTPPPASSDSSSNSPASSADTQLTDAQQDLQQSEAATSADMSSDQSAEKTALSTYQAQSAASQADIDKLTDAEVATLNEAPPAPPQPQANPLQRMAPLLLMSAFGGRATKMDAGLMLAATSGTVKGYLDGNAQAIDAAQKQYQNAYQQFKDRQEQQLKIYDTLKDAYAGRADADQKAWEMAHQMTGDDLKMDQNRLSVQEHMLTAAQQLKENNDKLTSQQYMARAKADAMAKAAKAKAAAKATQNAQAMDPASTATLAKNISTYRQPMPTMSGYALRNPKTAAWYADLVKQVQTLNPDYNQQLYATSQKARNAFTTGKQGDTVRSFNVLVNHLDTLQHLSDALGSGDVRVVNAAAQEVQRQLGVPAPTNFDAAKRLVADEINKAVAGTAGALGDRTAVDENLSRANSPQALSGVIDTYKDLAGGQLFGLKSQYEAGVQGGDFTKDLHLSPQALALLNRASATARAAGAGGQTSGAPAVGTVKQGYRYKGGDPAQPSSWEKVSG